MSRKLDLGRTLLRDSADFDKAVLETSFSAVDPSVRPDILVQANGIQDVIEAVQQAERGNLRVSVCSGGHSWSQNHLRQGGMLIDLGRLNTIEIDTTTNSAKVGPGCLSGDLNAALLREKLFFPVAHAYTVGLGGFLLKGGFGWNSRVVGPACQSVFGVDVVLADGTLVHANEHENSDLLWAARGSGPGFPGIVVKFYLRLHPRPRFTGLKIQVFRIRYIEDVLRWASSIGPKVPSQVEFQMVFNRKAVGIFAHGIEIISPVLSDSWREAKELTAFIDNSPLRKKASFTLPVIPLSLNAIMRAAEKVVFLPNIRWSTDNMWLSGLIEPALPELCRIAEDQPPSPSHALWMNWNPRSLERDDMAFSMEAQTYLALYGGLRGPGTPEQENWATRHANALAEHSPGVQLADENLARRNARFLSSKNMVRLEEIQQRRDPEHRFYSYGHLI